MADTIWPTVIGSAIPMAGSLLIVLLTRERSSGSDHTLVSQNTKDIEALQSTNTNIQSTLASMAALDVRREEDRKAFEKRIRDVESRQDRAQGREDGRHRNQGSS